VSRKFCQGCFFASAKGTNPGKLFPSVSNYPWWGKHVPENQRQFSPPNAATDNDGFPVNITDEHINIGSAACSYILTGYLNLVRRLPGIG